MWSVSPSFSTPSRTSNLELWRTWSNNVDEFEASRVGTEISCEQQFFHLLACTILMLQFVLAKQHSCNLTRSKEVQKYSAYTTRPQKLSKTIFRKPKLTRTNKPLKTYFTLCCAMGNNSVQRRLTFHFFPPNIFTNARDHSFLPQSTTLYTWNECLGRLKTPNSLLSSKEYSLRQRREKSSTFSM